jgi:cyclic pyranopterin phosphate synthase
MDLTTDAPAAPALIDRFGRSISYLRLSVTDRCDFRCTYCMAEQMTFLPKKDLLTLEELERLSAAFIERGVRKIRLTGGEPLVRRGIMQLIEALGAHVKSGALDELTLTTNASQLSKFTEDLVAAGVERINVSLDTLDPDQFATITRRGRLDQVLEGLARARGGGLKIKINAVALKGINDHEIPSMIEWAHGLGMDLTLIEVMPMGETGENRMDSYLPLSAVREELEKRWTLTDIPDRTGGPARYLRVAETGGRLGFITPLTQNFCEGCNRVRVTCTGEIYTCLGQEGSADLRAPLRASTGDAALQDAIDDAIAHKPKGHDFAVEGNTMTGSMTRHMSHTGG